MTQRERRAKKVSDKHFLQTGISLRARDGWWRKLVAKVRREKGIPDLSEAAILRLIAAEAAQAREIEVGWDPDEEPAPPSADIGSTPTPPPHAVSSGARRRLDDEHPTGEHRRGIDVANAADDKPTPHPHSPPASTLPSGRSPKSPRRKH